MASIEHIQREQIEKAIARAHEYDGENYLTMDDWIRQQGKTGVRINLMRRLRRNLNHAEMVEMGGAEWKGCLCDLINLSTLLLYVDDSPLDYEEATDDAC